MNILYLPYNMASMQSTLTKALNALPGITAKYVINFNHHYHADNDAQIFLSKGFTIRKPFISIYNKLRYPSQLKKLIAWADVIHYVWGPCYDDGRDLNWIVKCKKPLFIEWVGSDIRDPQITCQLNPYYKAIFNEKYEYYNFENSNHKLKVQSQFASSGAIATVCPEMSLYIDKKMFPTHITLLQRVVLDDFPICYPAVQNKKPLILHSPTAKIGKGSNIIINIIEELKKDFDFDFELMHNLPRTEVMVKMQQCDLFLDQIIVGGYGIATTEAMSFGKPVLCYLMPAIFDAGVPLDCPIINTNPDNLKEQLIRLITNPTLRNEIGKKSRQFVEQHHDAAKIAKNLVIHYKNAIDKINA